MARRSTTRITKLVVDRLPIQTTVWDSELKGFGVRRQRTAVKSYLLRKKVGSKLRTITIGQHGSPWTADTARIEALKLLGSIVRGEDPARHRQSDLTTMAELCERYMAQHARPNKKASSAGLDQKNIDNHVIPVLGNKLVPDVSASDIEGFKLAVYSGHTAPMDQKAAAKAQGGGRTVRGGHGVANRCLTLLSKMFKLAEIWELRPKSTNPVEGVSRYRENPAERFLSPAEFKRLGQTLDQFERDGIDAPYPTAAIKLLLLTGARLSEILTLRWDQVQIENRRARLSDSKTGPKTIHLSEPALAILAKLPRLSDNPHVIVGGKPGKHLVDLQRPWQRIRNKANLADVRIHDLRHTYASLAIQSGKSLSEIGELLGHQSTTTTKRYAHFAAEHIAKAGDEIGDVLASLLEEK